MIADHGANDMHRDNQPRLRITQQYLTRMTVEAAWMMAVHDVADGDSTTVTLLGAAHASVIVVNMCRERRPSGRHHYGVRSGWW